MSAKRTERLLSLVMALLSTRRGFSKQELFEEIEAYRTTASEQAREKLFDRDKAALREQGIPVETIGTDVAFETDTNSQRYRISTADYRLPELNFSTTEKAMLTLASRLWDQAAFGSAAQRALRKLSLRSKGHDDVDLPALQPRLSTADPHFAELWRATSTRRRISFDYTPAGSDGAHVRTLQPWGMGSRFGSWYLVGFDEDRQQERYFRLSRISGRISVHSGAYEVPAEFSIQASLASLDTIFTPRTAEVMLRPGAGHFLRAAGSIQPSTVTGEDVSSDVVHVQFTDVATMAGRIASLGSTGTVTAPAELRDVVVALLEKAQAAAGAPVPEFRLEATPDSMTRPTAKAAANSEDHLGRLLDLVPYVMHRQGVDLTETATRFNVTPEQLIKDLDLLFVSGPRHYPENLLEVNYEDNRIFMDNADKLSEPLRLAMDEACALIAGLESLKSVPGIRDNVALETALEKLSLAAGSAGRASSVLGSTLAERGLEVELEKLKGALETGRQVQLTYLVQGRDEVTTRLVDPLKLFSRDNDWYLEAWCTHAEGLRKFRLDRILEAVVTDAPVAERPSTEVVNGFPSALFTPGRNDTDVVFLLAESARWFAESYHASATAELSDGGLAAAVPVGNTAWVPGFVAAHGSDIGIARPLELRREVAQWIAAALASYNP